MRMRVCKGSHGYEVILFKEVVHKVELKASVRWNPLLLRDEPGKSHFMLSILLRQRTFSFNPAQKRW